MLTTLDELAFAIDEPAERAEILTASEHRGDGYVIYPHAFDLRLRPTLPEQDLRTSLKRIGWVEGSKMRDWRVVPTAAYTRYVLTGGVWVTGRRPRNPRLALARFNTTHGTCLYNLAIEVRPDGISLDLKSVRHADVGIIVGEVLNLSPRDFSFEYFRRIEWYVVLDPTEARRLAQQLDGTTKRGRGRDFNKAFHLESYPVYLRAGKRSIRRATLSIYRLQKGATEPYRCELALQGNRRDRTTIDGSLALRLRQTLADLMDRRGLGPLLKPARWEPRNREAAVERASFDPAVRGLPWKAYSADWGPRGPETTFRDCHTLFPLTLSHFPPQVPAVEPPAGGGAGIIPSKPFTFDDDGEVTTSPRIVPTTDLSGEKDLSFIKNLLSPVVVGSLIPRSKLSPFDRFKPSSAWKAVAQDVVGLPRGFLTELILDPDADVGPLLAAIGASLGGRLGVACLGPEGFESYSALEAARQHPFYGHDVDHFVIVTDASLLQCIPLLGTRPHPTATNSPAPLTSPAAPGPTVSELPAGATIATAVEDLPAAAKEDPRKLGVANFEAVVEKLEATREWLDVETGVGAREIASLNEEAEGMASLRGLPAGTGLGRDGWVPGSIQGQVSRVGARLWHLMRRLRTIAEETGSNITVITCDARVPSDAFAQDFSGVSVRSSLGDAARNNAHYRLRVEHDEDGTPTTVVVTKDGTEGLVGRKLFDRGGVPFRRDPEPLLETIVSESQDEAEVDHADGETLTDL